MNEFAEILGSSLQKPLPGTDVQMEMAPPDRRFRNFPKLPGPSTRVAAVLILLYQKNGTVFTAFIQRTEYEGVHSGQISFPGGMKEAADKDPIDTALRETNEEVGVDKSSISVLGTLTPLFIPVSDRLVTPVVGWTDIKPEFRLQTDEVVCIIEGELKKFLDPAIVRLKRLEVRGEMRQVRYFDYRDCIIWGATAMILNELLTIIKRSGIPLDIRES